MKIVLAETLRDLGVAAEIDRWTDADLMPRLWAKDPTVWFDEPTDEIADRLGWLDLPISSVEHISEIKQLADAAHDSVTHVVLCGMGGSSLAPEVFAATLPTAAGYPELIVLDSTHPDAVTAVANRIDLASTWFVISSKSGGTLETHSFMEYFWAKAAEQSDAPGSQFIATTDPGSDLAATGEARAFRAVFLADPNVGGRYSALTHFGLVPAALIGADISELLSSARSAHAMCGPDTPPALNPAMEIGAAMACGVRHGKGTTRFIGTGGGAHFGVWVEQLIAESTGKSGIGVVPVDHGPDRQGATDELVVAVGSSTATHADITISFSDPYDIAGAMFIMELATAIAGEILGIHPFNQPDVQRAKVLASQAIDGSLKATVAPLPVDDPETVKALDTLLTRDGLYVSIHAYVDPTPDFDAVLERFRSVVSHRTGLPTTVGYGPRFLHSTGQLHKGGPAGGLFIQFVDQPRNVVSVPSADFTFNDLIAGQAAGDRQALTDADRMLVAIDLGASPERGIATLADGIESPS